MRFVVDASLPRRVTLLLRQRGHEARDVRDIGLGTAPDMRIAEYARKERLILVSADFDFADIRAYPPQDYPGIVVIDRPEDAPVATVVKLMESVLMRTDLLEHLAGRLAIVGVNRIRLRGEPY